VNKTILVVVGFVACSVYEPELLDGPSTPTAGSSGTAGDASTAGTEGAQGGSNGQPSDAGSGGDAGAADTGGASGKGGSALGGDAGSDGESGGTAGSGGSAGRSGDGGNAGSSGGAEANAGGSAGGGGVDAGSGGTAGSGGSAGSAGTGGTAGTGGSAGTGGNAGTGGSGGLPGTIETLLIDDFEDGNHQIALEGQTGYWYAYNDGSGTQTPAPADPFAPVTINPAIEGSTSTKAVHVRWQGFTVWGAGFGAAFTDDTTFYDASAYDGITLWARLETGSETRVDLILQEQRSLAPACSVCGHHPIYRLNLSTEWQEFYIPFELFQGDGGGNPSFTELDPSGLYGLQFYRSANQTIDIWVDDIAFYRLE
jgi:hypothetical protein